MRHLFLILMMCSTGLAVFAAPAQRLVTPRGAELEMTVHPAAQPNRPTIIVAPGQSCNSKGPLFESFGKNAIGVDFTVVRFEWAYCLKDPTKPNPSENLKNEIEDFNTVLTEALSLDSVDAGQIFIAGKSIGSVVAHSVFVSQPNAKGLILLTPLCSEVTDINGQLLPQPISVCEENYPGLSTETRPVFMSMGDQDNSCLLPVLFDYLKSSKGNILVNVAGGDHGFRIFKNDQSIDEIRTGRNIESVVASVLNWAELKVRN